ncbi:hypothetical protein DID88_006513 [Monilinia fructigena]|uniref:Uncharacterized protein n=1 Tax=Monilinia fructigena TaxID=38457 RepID=A0A395IMA9_9HELO|nr:hypothetical protein DID88_006513 [Monilinia fructigena]
MDKFMKDEAKKARKEAKRIAEEEDALARKKADEFRSKALAEKYFNLWRINAHNIWSDNPLQRSLLSDPSFLNGGSRIHLMPTYQAAHETRPQISGVQTDYFRLKARGITTLPNGTPLATSVAKHPLRPKQSFDSVSKPIGTRKSMMPKENQIPRSSPARVPAQQLLMPAPTGEEEIQRLKEQARAVMEADSGRKLQKRGLDGDEELFERAKRIRERMDEDSEWLRREVDRYSESRSGSWS